MIAYVAIVAGGACLTAAGIVIVVLLRRNAALRRDVRTLGRVLADIADKIPANAIRTLRVVDGGRK